SGGLPQRRTSLLSAAEVPIGTVGSGRFGSVNRNSSKRASSSANGPSPPRMASLTSSTSRMSEVASPRDFFTLPISLDSRFFLSFSLSRFDSAPLPIQRYKCVPINLSGSGRDTPCHSRQIFAQELHIQHVNALRQLKCILDMLYHRLAA